MLLRISLILAIVAGLAAGALNFIMVKEKITTIQGQREDQRSQKEKALSDLSKTRKDLEVTTAKLKTTEEQLTTTTEERNQARTELAVQTRRADKLTDDLKKTTQERDVARGDLAAYQNTGYTPPQIMAFKKDIQGYQDQIGAHQAENKVLGQKINQLQVELERYTHPEKPVYLPAAMKGKVLVTDPKWNFVILDVGRDQGALEYGEMLVNRNGRLVAKVVIRTLQKDRCVANVLPGWELGEVMEGDQVIPAHPAS